MTVTEEFLKNNETYAAGFSGPLPLPPSKHIAIVACMDARLDVYRALGIEEGQAHVIRNAGGAVTDDVIRSLTISLSSPCRQRVFSAARHAVPATRCVKMSVFILMPTMPRRQAFVRASAACRTNAIRRRRSWQKWNMPAGFWSRIPR